MSDCKAGGLSRSVCLAKYKMLNLKDKHEQAKQINTELGDQVKARWEAMKGLKGAEYKAARADIEPLRQQKAKALENKNLILEKFKQAVEEYKVVKSGSAVKVSKTVAKYGTSSYDPSERKEWIKTCTAGGSCQRACAAKYKMLRLKELHEKLKAQSADLGVQVKAEWAAMKGLKGTEYKQARLDIEPLRQKKIKTANKKRTVLIKYKQAVQEYKAVAKLPCGKNTAKIAKEKADREA